MHIVVCMKQVPRDNSVKINSDLSINADGIEKIINLFDEYAIEEGLVWNEKVGGKLTVISLGSPDWVEQQRRALAMGASDALLLNDPAFANLDSYSAARAVAAAIKKLGDVDLVFAGRNSTDDESSTFVPALARLLGWAQLTYVGKVIEVDSKQITVERHLEAVVETVTAKLPAVVSVIKDINQPRYPSLLKIKKVAKIDPPVWSAADLGVGSGELAEAASVTKRVPPPARAGGEMIDGADSAEKVRKLVAKLLESQVL